MNKHHKKRARTIAVAVVIFVTAIGLMVFALRRNIDLYMTPTQLMQSPITDQQIILGGVVRDVRYDQQGLTVHFVVTDKQAAISVAYTGTLPALFRDGQQTVVVGKRTPDGQLAASRIYAKHDQYYKPAKGSPMKDNSHAT